MSADEKLIEEVARVWVDGGGDDDGFLFLVNRIQDAIVRAAAAMAKEKAE